MNKVAFRNIEAEMPANWSEIPKRTLLYLAGKFPYQPTDVFTYYFFFHCLNLTKRPRLAFTIARNFILSKKLNKDWKNTVLMEFGEENIFEQQIHIAISELKYFEWLHKDIVIPHCLIPKFSIGFTNYYGPREYMANVTADEFRHSEFFFVKFMKTKDVIYLHRLIATLWRVKSNGNNPEDIRIPFTEFKVEDDVKIVSKLSHKMQIACLLNYTGMRNYFTSSEDARSVFETDAGGSSGGDMLTNWGLILLRLSESSVFGNSNQTKNSYISDIILHLADMKRRNEKLKYDNQ